MARRNYDHHNSEASSIIDFKSKKAQENHALPIICERIRFYREKKGIEQKELAKQLGITGNSISNWETGRSRPDINLIPDICRILDISLNDLFGLPHPQELYTRSEKKLIETYRGLSEGHQYAVEQLMDSLMHVEKTTPIPRIRTLMHFTRSLAAGTGDPTEFEDSSTQIFLYADRINSRANCVFTVSGDSMEPDYHDGDLVLVERIPDAPELCSGEIGAFIVGNETYIKQYEKDGLHSLNPEYKTMRFSEEASVYLIGRVLGVLAPEAIATDDDVEGFFKTKTI